MNSEIEKLLSAASAELGYLEKKDNNNLDDKTTNAGSNNYTKYARDCFSNLQGMSWCCMFVWWCFEKVFGSGKAVSMIGQKTAKCSTMAANMANIGCKKVNMPQKGDIVFFKNPISHIGIVSEVNTNTFTTIEGNTSQSKRNEVIANGGGVFNRTYNYGIDRINCFYRPKWSNNSKSNSSENKTTNAANRYAIAATNVNIRSGAGTQYSILGNETLSFAFVKLGEQKDNKGYTWYSFSYKNQIGYIRSDFVKKL